MVKESLLAKANPLLIYFRDGEERGEDDQTREPGLPDEGKHNYCESVF
jgi:hypothetical protein